MSCNDSCSTGEGPFSQTRTGADTPASNCQAGGQLVFAGKFSVLGTADGATAGTPVTAGGPAGDHLLLQPFDNRPMRIKSMQIDGVALLSDGSRASAQSVLGVGNITLQNKEVRPTMTGSYENNVVCGEVLDCDRYQKCGIDALNSQCLPSFTNTNPLRIALAANAPVPGDIDGICITVELEYV